MAKMPDKVPDIVAVPLTRAGYDYLTATWPALLEGGIGELRLRNDARKLLNALHSVATGGSLGALTVTGGSPNRLDALLDESILQTNLINKLLGDIRVRS